VRQALQRGYRLGTLKVCHATGEGLALGVGFVTGRYGASGWSHGTLFKPCPATCGQGFRLSDE
jgi:hypothetical protein